MPKKERISQVRLDFYGAARHARHWHGMCQFWRRWWLPR